MSQTEIEPILLKEREVAKLLGCCVRTVGLLRTSGKLKAVKLTRAIRYTREEVDRFINAQMNDLHSKDVD